MKNTVVFRTERNYLFHVLLDVIVPPYLVVYNLLFDYYWPYLVFSCPKLENKL